MNFVSRMSKLISSSIKEQVLLQELKYRSIELKTIIDSVDEGIVAVDEEGKILYMNNWACELFEIKNHDVTGVSLDEVLPQNSVTKVLMTNKEVKEQEEVLKINNKTYRFLLSAKPIIFNKKKAGALACFKDFNKLHKSIFRISENPDALTFDRILGSSPSFTIVKEQARQIANQDITVLLIGKAELVKSFLPGPFTMRVPGETKSSCPLTAALSPIA